MLRSVSYIVILNSTIELFEVNSITPIYIHCSYEDHSEEKTEDEKKEEKEKEEKKKEK